MGIKVLFIDDKKAQFDKVEEVFSNCDFFELVNKTPIFDESSHDVLDRLDQKTKIVDLLKGEDYDIVLFDLSLRSDREENFRAGEADNLLSIEIYNEMREWLSCNKKKFVFVTGHDSWKTEEQFRTIGEAVKGAAYMRKPSDMSEYYTACVRIDQNGQTKCGEKFKHCNKGMCFNKILRRIANND